MTDSDKNVPDCSENNERKDRHQINKLAVLLHLTSYRKEEG